VFVLFFLLASHVFSEEIDCRSPLCRCQESGHCQIYCDGGPDQCKSSSLVCKAGFPCTIYCLGDTVCKDARIDGSGATDFRLLCDGVDSCKASSFQCGDGQCTLECASATGCEDAVANMGGASGFNCFGFCSESKGVPKPITPRPTKRPTLPPTAPSVAPSASPSNVPTLSPVEPQYVSCSGIGAECKCNNARPCVLQCDAADSCTDSALICPPDFDCTVECGHSACGKAVVSGPIDRRFEMSCFGVASCGDVAVDSAMASDTLFVCSGKDSCKGAGTALNCGKALCSMLFSGESAGDSATISTNFAVGFSCEGRYAQCPPDFLAPCPAPGASACTAAQVFDPERCRCECPFVPEAGSGCPGRQRFDSKSCRCEVDCAAGTPTEAQCAAQGLAFRDCACWDSNYCCLTNPVQPEPKQWAGRCWGETLEVSCLAQPNQRCVWSPNECLQNPPRNGLDPSRPCSFADIPCARDSDCCSEFCRADGLCR